MHVADPDQENIYTIQESKKKCIADLESDISIKPEEDTYMHVADPDQNMYTIKIKTPKK